MASINRSSKTQLLYVITRLPHNVNIHLVCLRIQFSPPKLAYQRIAKSQYQVANTSIQPHRAITDHQSDSVLGYLPAGTGSGTGISLAGHG